MGLPVPNVAVDPAPQWASDLNACMSVIDQHTHLPGSGVPITPSALNINSDVTFANNNATNLRSSRYFPQGSPLAQATDLGCVYVSGVDLWYNDGVGNQIRITQGGSVTGSTGTITGLPSGTAGASYGAGVFTFQSATNTSANIDAGSYVFRNAIANSKGLTLSPPAAMASNYGLVLPTVPASTSFVTLDTSGNFSGSIATVGGITNTNLAASNYAISSSCVSFTTSSTSFVAVTNLSVTLSCTGTRLVFIGLIDDTNGGYINVSASGGGIQFEFLQDGTNNISAPKFVGVSNSGYPPSILNVLLVPSAGSHTFSVQVRGTPSGTVSVFNTRLIAVEL